MKNEPYRSKYSDTLNLRDSLLKQSTRSRNLEIGTDVQTYKSTGGIKAYSTKSKDLQERLQVSSIGASDYSTADYAPKYFVNQSAIYNMNKFDYTRTEGNYEKLSITPSSKQKNALGRILANASEKGQSGSIRKPFQNEEEDSYDKVAPQTALKVNNFFASSKRKELENSLQKRDKSLNYSTKEHNTTNDREDMGRSIDVGMKSMTNKSQIDYKPSYKGFIGMDDSKDDIKDARNLSLTVPSKESKSLSATTQKSSLNSFITKVDKGSALPIRPKNDDDETSSKPYLTLEEKASLRPNRNASESMSQSTTNAESKTITFGKNRASQQALASSQDVVRPKAKSFGLVSPPTKDISRDQDTYEDYTPKRDLFTYYITSQEKHHRNYNETDYFCQIYKEHLIQSFQALTFCKYLRPVDPKMLAQKKVFLPKKPAHKDKKSIIFDLDETLIHCNESADIPSDVVLPIRFPHGEIIEAGINIRPYAIEILKEMSQHFEVIVFTASHSCYANVVLDYLDPHGQYVHHRLFRESCVVTDEGVYIKDLRILGNRNLQDVVLVDNAAYSFGYQVENGIPIIPYYDNKEDQELKHLIPYLKSLANVKDCREVNKQTFRFHQYTMHDSLEKVVNKVILKD
jgi:Dullard-like phosphatase family protein